MTLEQLKKILVGNTSVDGWFTSLDKFLPEYEINTNKRIAAFIGECSVESDNFTRIKENLNYKAESLVKVWPSHFATLDIAKQYEHNQEKIANRAYAGRMGNGDEASGDGWKFAGKGLIQITGKVNYEKFAESIGKDIEELPEYLLTFDGATESACWFWKTHNLNAFADAGDIDKISKVINGGTLGLEERRTNYQHALNILGG